LVSQEVPRVKLDVGVHSNPVAAVHSARATTAATTATSSSYSSYSFTADASLATHVTVVGPFLVHSDNARLPRDVCVLVCVWSRRHVRMVTAGVVVDVVVLPARVKPHTRS
jgi:hypothetical protein